VTELRSRGIQPDAIVCRSDRPIPYRLKEKISALCDVPVSGIVSAIDADSRLRNDTTQEGRQRCPLHVQSRPFATVPYMGNGRGNPDVESSLIYSEWARIERPCGTVTETFFDGQFTPLVPHLAAHIQNPSNLIPEVAAAGWIRAGIPSRQFVRDLNC
jgi:hypothetical protein